MISLMILAGCDSLPEGTSGISRPPAVANLSFSPETINIGDLPASSVVNGMAQIDFFVEVDASDPDGTVESVHFILRSPTVGSEALANVEMQPVTGQSGRYAISHQQSLDEGETGAYVVEAYAVDNAGVLSNRVLGTFTLDNIKEPPVIEEIIAPDTVTRPQSGSVSFQIIAVASDPQGIANISTVEFWNINSPQSKFALSDDGSDQSGDQTAGDGRFTITVSVNSGNAPGENTFAFQATDRSGLKSEVVQKVITIE